MKRSTLLRRLMILSIVFEEIYFLLITIIYIFRPAFYSKALISVFDLNSEIPPNSPDTALMITLYGGVVLYFILWFIMKLLMDTDSDPLFMGVVTFLALPVSQVVYTYMYGRTQRILIREGQEAFAFHMMNFTVMKYCGWANIAAFIFLMMAYAVARQKHADLA
ncbi:MAG: hypothetical protein IJJ76_05825 [Ruminococcus sp.]|uniref:hypothetical protein n=1 Tax=Ruminococcus sp. TaxID=41978 RepID=UPI0025DEDCDE|nr:hypothetical protein [Ruminococcus sp.]MBR0529271.1 hypothetical protein [Ruminococcus sp.]